MVAEALNSGSRWRRWEPHVHAPGTVFNNQFKGPTAWNDYLTSLEQAEPNLEAIAVTDYYCTDTYEQVVREMKENGRLPQVALVFPNVELRLDVATVKDRWTNIHFLVSPDDPRHVFETQRFLGRLRFEAFGDYFACNREDLIKLGRRSDPDGRHISGIPPRRLAVQGELRTVAGRVQSEASGHRPGTF